VTSSVLPAKTDPSQYNTPASFDTSKFPVSFCRHNAYLEITWWPELAKETENKSTPNIVLFKITRFPDPTYVTGINLPSSGGSIAFDPAYGATASSGISDWTTLRMSRV
jgi:hypothetical protein